MNTPKWAQDLILDAILYIQSATPLTPELPDINWRHAKDRRNSSGICHPRNITIVKGSNRVDAKLVILHELAHWALPEGSGHEGHTPRFWDLAWQLFREFKLPIRHCKKRESEYRKGSLVAYHRSRKSI